jgi:glycosyltransferase involved in cell wall biosynthesis
VSFIIFGYNQEALVDQAIAGAFAQDYDNLEIVLSDDCSRDETYARMVAGAAAYRGPHRIVVNKTPGNRGTFAHAHDAVSRASGALLVMAAADDISYPWRVRRLVEEWQRTGAAALFSKYDVIDETGAIIEQDHRYDHSGLEYLSYFEGEPMVPVHGASSAYTRETFELLTLPDRPILFEDTYLSLGLTLLGKRIVYVDEALVQYRQHGQSITNTSEVENTYQDILRRERRAQAFAESIATVLEELRALSGSMPDARPLNHARLERDLAFYRHRSDWLSIPASARLKALLGARRWAHLRWHLARSAGVRGLTAAKALRQAIKGRARAASRAGT